MSPRYIALVIAFLTIDCSAPAPRPVGFVFDGDDDELREVARAVLEWNQAGALGETGQELYVHRGTVAGPGEWLVRFDMDEAYVATGYPEERIIRLNARIEWYLDVGFCYSGYDLQTAVEHEIGHTLGAVHTGSRHDVMYPDLAACERRQVLSDADREQLGRDGG